MQEIYLRLQGRPDEAIGDPAAFLYRVGWNLMLDQMRSRRRSSAREAEWTRMETVSAGAATVDPAPPADAAVEARQRLERLTRRLETLPAQTQRVFRLHKFEGLSHAQTAERLGISRSAVEKHMISALKALVETGS